MISNLKLHEKISDLPIYFCQVREDSSLDNDLVNSLDRASKVLMVSSGGDSLARLSANKLVTSIDAVDVNKAQLSLTQFKLALLKFSRENRLKILGHSFLDKNTRWQLVNEICKDTGIELSLLGPKDLIFEDGIDFCGRFEQLFKGIQRGLSFQCLRPVEIVNNLQLIRTVFDEYFSLELLINLFGNDATQNPIDKFSSHFYKQLLSFLSNESFYKSPFLNQLLFGRFSGQLYEWISLPALKDFEICDVNFHEIQMLDFLKGSNDSSYDLIHLSNILDWLSEEEAKDLLDNAYRVLKRGGKLIIRQLNSSLDVMSMSNKILWDLELSKNFLHKDQSFFYRAIHIGEKKF